MDILTGFSIGAILATIVGALLAEQAKASSPGIAKWIVMRAVRRVPVELRERLEEEWLAVIEGTPGPVAKIWIAVGFRWSVAQIVRAHFPVPAAAPRRGVLSWAVQRAREHRAASIEARVKAYGKVAQGLLALVGSVAFLLAFIKDPTALMSVFDAIFR